MKGEKPDTKRNRMMTKTSRLYAAILSMAAAATLCAQLAGPTLKTIHNFTGTNGDGGDPLFGPTIGKGGVLYGTTSASSTSAAAGTIYSLTPPAAPGSGWAETVLYSFPDDGSTGSDPIGNIVIDKSGVLYGTTAHGGASFVGLVFSLTPPASAGQSWTQAVLYEFTGGSDGSFPGGLVMGSGRVLYGYAGVGGDGGFGTLYSLAPPVVPGNAWTHATLYSFKGGSDGNFPIGISIGTGGVLYGATENGGTGPCRAGCGTVFSLAPPASAGDPWIETVLHTFTNGPNDGAFVHGGVAIGAGGTLYGAAAGGGTAGGGIVYSLTPPAAPGGAWTEKVLHQFAGSDGLSPAPGIAISHGGVLYGTTRQGGSAADGTVFSLKP
jgi:uncharacterized repeat protein (TIGR03803 family)